MLLQVCTVSSKLRLAAAAHFTIVNFKGLAPFLYSLSPANDFGVLEHVIKNGKTRSTIENVLNRPRMMTYHTRDGSLWFCSYIYRSCARDRSSRTSHDCEEHRQRLENAHVRRASASSQYLSIIFPSNSIQLLDFLIIAAVSMAWKCPGRDLRGMFAS
jgi:hypothetical protein